MPTAGGPNTLGESNLVFAYDTGDVKNSYIGEPTTNFVKNDSWGGDGVSQTLITKGKVTITDPTLRYKGLHTVLWAPGTNRNCYLNGSGPLYFDQTSTVWTFSCYLKREDGAPISGVNVYMYNIGSNTGVGTIQDVGDGWYRVSRTVSTAANYVSLVGFYNLVANTRYYLSGWQLEKKGHPTPATALTATRSATQGLLPVIGNSTIDLSNVSFDASAKITFDGTNDYVSIPSKSFTINEPWSFSLLVKTNTAISSAWKNLIGATGDTECMWMMHPGGFALYQAYYNSQTYIWWSGINVANMVVNTWNSITITCSPVNSTTTYFTSYLNGNKINEGTFTWAPINTTQVFSRIGGNGSRYFHGEVPVAKIYNRALTAQEIKQNYQQYKTRFNLN